MTRFQLALLAVLLAASLCAAQTTVTLNGTGYTVKAHPRLLMDGAAGALSLSMQDTTATGKANAANPPFSNMKSAVNTFIAKGYNWPGGTYFRTRTSGSWETWDLCLDSALLWWAQGALAGDPNGYLALAKYCVNHVEEYVAGSMGCDQSRAWCGRARPACVARSSTSGASSSS